MKQGIEKFSYALLSLLIFAIPIEHKYDKFFRYFSKTLLPEGLLLPRGFDKKIYFYASDIAAICLFILAIFSFRIPLRRLLFEKKAPCLWILFTCATLSVLASPLASYPVIYTRFVQLLTPIFLFSFLAHCIPTDKALKMVFFTFFASALLQSAIAIAQYFAQDPIGIPLLGEPRMPTGTFGHSGENRWLFDSFFSHIPSHPYIIRSSGTFPHCNVLGGFLSLSLFITYSLITTAKARFKQLWFGIALIIQFFALSTAFSRAALFAWGLGTLVWISYWIYKKGMRAFFKDRAVRFLGGAILTAVILNGTLFSEQYIKRGGFVNYNETAQGSDALRIGAQKIAFNIIKDHPWIGVGYQQYNRGASLYLPPGIKPVGVHNIYLFLGAETGLISLAAFLCFIGAIIFQAIRAPYTPEVGSLLAAFIALLFMGGCDFYPFLFQQGKLMFFSIAALLVSRGSPQLKYCP